MVDAERLTGEELAVLAIMRGYKPAYRAGAMAEVGLGAYDPGNPTIATLATEDSWRVWAEQDPANGVGYVAWILSGWPPGNAS